MLSRTFHHTRRTWRRGTCRPFAVVVVALLLVAGTACSPQLDMSAELSEDIATVVVVTIETDRSGVDDVLVDFGRTTSYGSTAPADQLDDGTWQALLLGNKPNSEIHYRATMVSGEQSWSTEDQTISTGPSHPDLPALDVSVHEPFARDGFFLVTLYPNPSAAVIIDADGDYLWWYLPEHGFETSETRALLAQDGQSMLVRELNEDREYSSQEIPQRILRVGLDGAAQEVVADGLVHLTHDWLELPDGTITLLQKDVRQEQQLTEPCEGGGQPCVSAECLLEITPGAGGEVTETVVWDAWDGQPYTFDIDQFTHGSDDSNWTHGNALDWSEQEQAYYLGLRSLSTILRIDRTSGEVVTTYGGETLDYVLVDPDTPHVGFVDEPETIPFSMQHQFQFVDGDLLVYDNRHEPDDDHEEEATRIVRYSVDEVGGTMTQTWEYVGPGYTHVLGDVSQLPGDDREVVLVTWSQMGQLNQFGHDGEVLWQLNSPLGSIFGYTSYMESIYDTLTDLTAP